MYRQSENPAINMVGFFIGDCCSRAGIFLIAVANYTMFLGLTPIHPAYTFTTILLLSL
jgi:hypothetical protein